MELEPERRALKGLLFIDLFLLHIFPSSMSSETDSNASPTDQLPPPAYEVSQEEFDNKTSRAVEESLSAAVSNVRIVDDDGWPVYDAQAFETVAASYERHSAASSSAATETEHYSSRAGTVSDKKTPLSLPTIMPLRIPNRAPASSPDPERLHSRSRSPQSDAFHRHPSPSLPVLRVPSPSFPDHEPPPPFSPINHNPHDGFTHLQYNPEDPRASSPLYSPEPTRSQIPTLSLSSPSLPRQSPPIAARHPVQRRVRQSNDYLKDHSLSNLMGQRKSRLDFNPLTAYSKDSYETPYTQTPAQNFSASDFYQFVFTTCDYSILSDQFIDTP